MHKQRVEQCAVQEPHEGGGGTHAEYHQPQEGEEVSFPTLLC